MKGNILGSQQAQSNIYIDQNNVIFVRFPVHICIYIYTCYIFCKVSYTISLSENIYTVNISHLGTGLLFPEPSKYLFCLLVKNPILKGWSREIFWSLQMILMQRGTKYICCMFIFYIIIILFFILYRIFMKTGLINALFVIHLL